LAGDYVYIWTFNVKPGCGPLFEKIYGPDGAWVRLFGKASGYVKTELIRHQAVPNRYVTIDYWQDEASHHLFRSQYAREFGELDARCEDLTESEEHLGDFTTVEALQS
jgi:heme-degrading monooxygenase HmoA